MIVPLENDCTSEKKINEDENKHGFRFRMLDCVQCHVSNVFGPNLENDLIWWPIF